MQIIWFVVLGFVAGLVARAIMPGRQPMGLAMTTLLGILGSFVGGLFSSLFSHRGVSLLQPSGILGSIIGAVIVLAIAGAVNNRRRTTQIPSRT
jgi:uncharacterized membrane protein YeaQ/YmgE (transglycosylase-associated protein family)